MKGAGPGQGWERGGPSQRAGQREWREELAVGSENTITAVYMLVKMECYAYK